MAVTIDGLPVPDSWLTTLRRSPWQKGQVVPAELVALAPWLEGMPLEFAHTENDIEKIQRNLRFNADRLPLEKTGMVRGSRSDLAPSLPWLDVEKAVAIGVNACLGDDQFIVLDYRESPSEPRVVIDKHNRRPDARSVDYTITWIQVAGSCSEFCRLLGLRGWWVR